MQLVGSVARDVIQVTSQAYESVESKGDPSECSDLVNHKRSRSSLGTPLLRGDCDWFCISGVPCGSSALASQMARSRRPGSVEMDLAESLRQGPKPSSQPVSLP